MTEKDDRVPATAIFETLRNRICLLDYPPGTVLRESDLAAEFGISRTPIRAVLQQLAHGGLIESRDGVGTIVTDLTFEETREIYQMRLKMAELIGRMSPLPLTQETTEAAAGLKRRALDLTKNFDIEAYWQINHDLHFLISGIIGNAPLRQMWDHFYFQVARIWYRHAQLDPRGVAAALAEELREVERAITGNDATALGYVQRNHIAYGLARLEAAR